MAMCINASKTVGCSLWKVTMFFFRCLPLFEKYFFQGIYGSLCAVTASVWELLLKVNEEHGN